MLLSKEIAVVINLSACKLKQYTANMLRKNNVGLTPEQFLLIDIIWNQGEMSQQKLADTMQKDKNSITKLINSLEKKGLIIRTRDENDKRSNIISLTHKSREMKNYAKETGIKMLDNILEGIDEEELRSFLSTLNKLTANMNKYEK